MQEKLLKDLSELLQSKDTQIRKLQAQLMIGEPQGIFVPAMKLGDKIYYLDDWQCLEIKEFKINEVKIRDGEWHFFRDSDDISGFRVASFYRDSSRFCSGYYSTKQEAEEALEKRKEQNKKDRENRHKQDIEAAKKLLEEEAKRNDKS